MTLRGARRAVGVWVLWLGLYALTVTVLVWANEALHLRPSHSILLFILLVAGGSLSGGRPLAAVLTVGGYLGVDYLFIPPIHRLGRPQDQDWIVLAGFLVTGFVLGELVTQLRRAAELARSRAAEIEELSAERLRLEREAAGLSAMREAEALYAALLAAVTHDLRTPLAAIQMLADPMRRSTQTDALPRIRAQAERLTEFVSSLGRIGALGSVTDAFQFGTHDLSRLLDRALDTAAPVLGERLPPISCQRPWPARCDPLLTHHALVNLLENAARYAPADAPVEVSIEAAGTMTRVDVLDRGPGLAPDEVERVFAPRARGEAAAGISGSGMGLAIARSFARAQGGDISYRPREGGGSVFTLTLPTAPSPGG